MPRKQLRAYGGNARDQQSEARALVVGRDIIERRGSQWLLRLPALGATALLVAGSVVAVQGLRALS